VERVKILIVAEAVTLAHVARPLALAAGLDPRRFEVHFAVDPRFDALIGALPHTRHEIRSIGTDRFLDALDRGVPVYTADDLRRYVGDDERLIADVAPAVVVGDFRLSLSVSARRARVPYAAIANMHWSPRARPRFPLPELPLTRALGVGLARPLVALARPLAFALHARPLNRVRREHGLPSLGPDLRRTYTDADEVLYADLPELAPPHSLGPGHRFLGPVLWSPAIPLPEWWAGLPADRPLVYVTPGTSGRRGLLDAALRGLTDLPVTVVAAAGAELPSAPARNAHVAAHLPGMEAARRAAVVVCNGGMAVQQALACGRPVLGLPANMDQHLSMRAVADAGAGLLLRSEHARPAAIALAVGRLLEEPSFRLRAEALAAQFAAYDAPSAFAAAVEELADISSRSTGSRVDRAAAGGPPPIRP
jgi:UDP:flavonoid glycosyltransferase YjiC (YdhE family)